MKRNLLLITITFLCINSYATIYYVKATGSGTGISWTNASNDLQLMINQSAIGDTIWVAGGTYYANRSANALSTITPNNRNNAFVLKDSIFLFGSFAGTETALSQRTPSVMLNNPSILSGDLGTLNDSTDNAYHVMICVGTATVTVDGFTITRGTANGGSSTIPVNSQAIWRDDGAGIYNSTNNIVLRNATVSHNSTGNVGAGLLNGALICEVTNVKFIHNICTGNSAGGTTFSGAGIKNFGTICTLNNDTFIDNIAIHGAGMSNEGSTTAYLTNVYFANNFATDYGGAISNITGSIIYLTDVIISGNKATNNGGGIYNASTTIAYITNTLISGNLAQNGGGICNNQSSPVITNVTISGDSAISQGGGIYNFGSGANPKIRNSIIYDNSSGIEGTNADEDSVVYSLIQGITTTSATTGNIIGSTNPLFVNQLPPGLDTGGDYHLQMGSPLIDIGNNYYYITTGLTPDLSSITTDLDGNPRIMGNIVDFGAYEQGCIIPIDLGNDTLICEGTTLTLNAGNNYITYTWSTGDSISNIIVNDSGMYSVMVKDSNGCKGFDTIQVGINPLPNINITGDTIFCHGSSTLTANATGNSPFTYNWSSGDNNATTVINSGGNYTVTVIDNNGCSNKDSIEISEYPLPSIAISGRSSIQSGESDTLTASGADTYTWNTGSTTDTTIVAPTQTTTYLLTGADSNGCRVSDTFTVHIEVELHFAIGVPSAFSPNGDGINDILFVRGSSVKSLQFLIYNRYGQKVFESDDMATGWDGTMQGKKLNPGVFVYYVKATFLDNTIKKIKGNVTLVR